MMKIAITGAGGQLGSELQSILELGRSELGTLPSAYKGCKVTALDADQLDITDPVAVDQFLGSHSFSMLFNCAAITNVDGCETQEEIAEQVNAIGPRNLAVSCHTYGCRLVHVSTDYVFNGTGNVPFREDDRPNPKSAYGRTKLHGEQYVMEADSDAVICRTAWLYGYHGNNFPKKIMKLAREKGALKVVTDQRGNPTCAVDLAWEMVSLAVLDVHGIFHCTCNGEAVSRYEFAKAVLEDAGIPCNLQPCLTSDFPRRAVVPAFSGLSKEKLDSFHLNWMRDWRSALKGWMEHYKGTEEFAHGN